jgi:hypothetical protein
VPDSALLIPALSLPTGTRARPRYRDSCCAARGAMMPKRNQSKATERLRRIMAERSENLHEIATRRIR